MIITTIEQNAFMPVVTSFWRHGSYIFNRALTDADVRPGIISKAAFQFYSTWIA